MRYFLSLLSVLLFAGFALSNTASAQNALPKLPEPIQNLVNDGAQIRFLGKENGFDAWLTIKNGQEQYFYVKPDGKSFVMGVLFDENGKAVTLRQLKRLREKGDPLVEQLATENTPATTSETFEFKSPAEEMLADIEAANWIPLGDPEAPVIYSFVDPQCPHCHAMIHDFNEAGHISKSHVQIRIVPVGFRDETLAQSAFLLAAPNAQERWMKHLAGDEAALPAPRDINTQGVQRNLAVMQKWELNATPFVVYRGRDGSVKLVRGRPKDVEALIADLGNRS